MPALGERNPMNGNGLKGRWIMFPGRIFIMAAAASFTLALPATAQSQAEQRTARISIADLELSDPADVEILRERVQSALRAMCRPLNVPGFSTIRQRAECRRSAQTEPVIEELVRAAQSGSPSLARK